MEKKRKGKVLGCACCSRSHGLSHLSSSYRTPHSSYLSLLFLLIDGRYWLYLFDVTRLPNVFFIAVRKTDLKFILLLSLRCVHTLNRCGIKTKSIKGRSPFTFLWLECQISLEETPLLPFKSPCTRFFLSLIEKGFCQSRCGGCSVTGQGKEGGGDSLEMYRKYCTCTVVSAVVVVTWFPRKKIGGDSYLRDIFPSRYYKKGGSRSSSSVGEEGGIRKNRWPRGNNRSSLFSL